jgi:hypothetical protein
MEKRNKAAKLNDNGFEVGWEKPTKLSSLSTYWIL